MDQIKLILVASRLFCKHDLDGWGVGFKPYCSTLARCDHDTKTIWFNDHYVEHSPENHVRDTLKHEVAHCLTPGHGHDEVWRAVAEKLGTPPRALSDQGAVTRPGRYQATCLTCGRLFNKYRLPKYILGYYCPRCGKEKGELRFTSCSTEKLEKKSGKH
jgi:predicted SprT family Zn-dependent metalloprotease